MGSEQADDVVTETFVVVWRRWSDLPSDPSRLRGWVFVVARHKAMHLRSETLKVARLRDQLAGQRHAGVSSCDTAELVVESDTAARALDSLSASDREVLLLVGVEGLSPDDAAAVLGCSVRAMTTRLSRARQRLEGAMQVPAETTSGRWTR